MRSPRTAPAAVSLLVALVLLAAAVLAAPLEPRLAHKHRQLPPAAAAAGNASDDAAPHALAARRVNARFGRDKLVRGVNLGGWFLLEAWETPHVFLTPDIERQQLSDEWAWMEAKGARAKADLVAHYNSYYTEQDFAEMAQAGLNTVRIPLPFWTFVPTVAPEPYLVNRQRAALRRALGWALKYHLDVVLDLHALPGNINGQDNGGRLGQQDWAKDPKNLDRSIAALQNMVELYVNNASYGGVVKAIQVANEPRINSQLSLPFLGAYHKRALAAVRKAVAPSALVRPTTMFSDAFQDVTKYNYMFPTRDFPPQQLVVDKHFYFVKQWDRSLPDNDEELLQHVCAIGPRLRKAHAVRPVVVGEFSLGRTTRCVDYHDCKGRTIADDLPSLNSRANNLFMRRFAEAQLAAYEQAGGWLMWTWKTDAAAAWSYQAARAQGWLPSDVSDPTQRLYTPAPGTATEQRCVSEQPSRAPRFATQS